MIEFLYAIIGSIVGGSGVWVFTLKSQRRLAKAEAMKAEQDVYQETITDLREDKRILKEEKEEIMRKFEEKLKMLENKIDALKNEVQTLMIKNRKEACVNFSCKERVIS